NPLAAFYHVTLPLLRPGIIIASLLAFIASFNEFLITLFVIGASEATLPIQLWKGVRFETNPTIAAASTIFLTVSSLTLLGVEAMKWRQRRMTGSSGDLLSG
ncbi:MAG TPA: ABC transporter permease subunit, partial [Dehalococcoidia bacterium]|nr:ABC transporter permease subunit [Dehalococcoidia bacterium]